MAPKQRLWNNQALVHEDQLPGATKAKKERQMRRVCISSFCDTVMRVYLGAQLVWGSHSRATVPGRLPCGIPGSKGTRSRIEGGGYNLQMPPHLVTISSCLLKVPQIPQPVPMTEGAVFKTRARMETSQIQTIRVSFRVGDCAS